MATCSDVSAAITLCCIQNAYDNAIGEIVDLENLP